MNVAKTDTLLVEVLAEELPPRALATLGAAFRDAIVAGLAERKFLAAGGAAIGDILATPRRLAALIPDVAPVQADQLIERKGPYVAQGLDQDGKPTPALAGFARSCGVAVAELGKANDGKGEHYLARIAKKGEPLEAHLQDIVGSALKKLPVPKLMRWGDGDAQFVRPAHSLVMLHGKRVVDGELLGLKAGRSTLGHRFLGRGEIRLAAAGEYAATLRKEGSVMVEFAARKADIALGLRAAADKHGATLAEHAALLDEVTALVEYPYVYTGTFDPAFLAVPQECLVLSMKQHQKYFPLVDGDGKLTPRFLIVANIDAADPHNIVHGNERVLRARLSDAKFFYDQDRKTRLEARVPRLAGVVYHNKLGSQLARVQRVTGVAAAIARLIGADVNAVSRAAHLCKADLLTDMVGEFPELQGTMGKYYALADGEEPRVADAIEQHYRPRFAGDSLPEAKESCALALADKLDTLAGMFGLGQQPTGDKDPFALRRNALGIVRILVERKLAVSVSDLIKLAFSEYPPGVIGDAHTDLQSFILERLRGYLRETGYSANEVEAVLCMIPTQLDQVPLQLAAVRAFAELPEAASLAAANKRVANILRQAESKGESFANADAARLREPAERALFEALKAASLRATPLFRKMDYAGYLKAFAALKIPIDEFFDSVMVMVDDADLRKNRLALLADLRIEMNRVADLSMLAA